MDCLGPTPEILEVHLWKYVEVRLENIPEHRAALESLQAGMRGPRTGHGMVRLMIRQFSMS